MPPYHASINDHSGNAHPATPCSIPSRHAQRRSSRGCSLLDEGVLVFGLGIRVEAKGLLEVIGHVLALVVSLITAAADKERVEHAAEDRRKEGDDDICTDEDEECRIHRVGLVRGDDDEVAEPAARERHRDELDPLERHAYRRVDRELTRVCEDEAEGLEARLAEGRALESHVDVCVAGDELDRLLKAPHAALRALEDDHNQRVLALQVLRVLVDGHQDDADQLDDGDDEGAERDRAEVVEADAAERAREGRLGLVFVGLAEEEPVAHGARHGRPRCAAHHVDRPEKAEEDIEVDGDLHAKLRVIHRLYVCGGGGVEPGDGVDEGGALGDALERALEVTRVQVRCEEEGTEEHEEGEEAELHGHRAEREEHRHRPVLQDSGGGLHKDDGRLDLLAAEAHRERVDEEDQRHDRPRHDPQLRVGLLAGHRRVELRGRELHDRGCCGVDEAEGLGSGVVGKGFGRRVPSRHQCQVARLRRRPDGREDAAGDEAVERKGTEAEA
mmetsp:Transcript_45112/g.118310  ORF Transcript_45112/g.118310 Transcript_45112/m.118310 type:complete len:500 (-) Transcript_45112:885-2384(-)